MRKSSNKAPWKRKRPKARTRTKLNEDDKDAAQSRAARAGRRYPNLVDNMWAAKRKKKRKTKNKTKNKKKRDH